MYSQNNITYHEGAKQKGETRHRKTQLSQILIYFNNYKDKYKSKRTHESHQL